MAIEAHATAKYVRTSAQKAGLVLDLIRGRDVNHALATLRFARKGVARDIEKVLRSAIANAQNKDGFAGDVDRLFVAACFANQGPSQKRIRPAPMGRAFRVVKRTAHLTVKVAEKPVKVSAPAPGTDAEGAAPRPRRKGAAPKKKAAAAAPRARSSAKKKEAKA
ncbi:MAG TPA: 50S ribosomal protein L22 [Vicinamibacterales bacterium]|nr:50S ribosomal protein L22 [Vicinamibacterales bacterium]